MDGRVGPEEVAAALLEAIERLGPLPLPVPPAGIGLSGFEAASDEAMRQVRELAISACAALERLFERDEAAIVSYTGNVFLAGEFLLQPFAEEVAARRPLTTVVPPEGDSLAGAALLAELGPSLPREPGILWGEA